MYYYFSVYRATAGCGRHQTAGAAGVIIMNHAEAEQPEESVTMGNDDTGRHATIPSTFVTRSRAVVLMEHAQSHLSTTSTEVRSMMITASSSIDKHFTRYPVRDACA